MTTPTVKVGPGVILAITPNEAAAKTRKRLERIKSRFKAYTGSAMHDMAVAFKMHWIEGINARKYDGLRPEWRLAPSYYEWKKTETSVPQYGMLDGRLIASIEKYKIDDVAYGVRINRSAAGVGGYSRNKSRDVLYYARKLEYGHRNTAGNRGSKATYSERYQKVAARKGWPTSPGTWIQKPRPILYETKVSFRGYWNRYLKKKFGHGWPRRIADGAL